MSSSNNHSRDVAIAQMAGASSGIASDPVAMQQLREMFPGIKEDGVDSYGKAATLRLPGKHIEMINRCLSNKDRGFTGAMERFLCDHFADAWWWA